MIPTIFSYSLDNPFKKISHNKRNGDRNMESNATVTVDTSEVTDALEFMESSKELL